MAVCKLVCSDTEQCTLCCLCQVLPSPIDGRGQGMYNCSHVIRPSRLLLPETGSTSTGLSYVCTSVQLILLSSTNALHSPHCIELLDQDAVYTPSFQGLLSREKDHFQFTLCSPITLARGTADPTLTTVPMVRGANDISNHM